MGGTTSFGDFKPDCDLREATHAAVQLGLGDAYEAAGDVPGDALLRRRPRPVHPRRP